MGALWGTSRARLVVFAICVVVVFTFIARAAFTLAAGPPYIWSVALVATVCAAVLETCLFPIGRFAHRSPLVSLPVLVLAVATPALTPDVVIGAIALGVLIVDLGATRRPRVAAYSSALAASVTAIAALAQVPLGAVGLTGAGAAAVVIVVYLIVVVAIELARMRWVTPAPGLGLVRDLSPLRVLGVAAAGAAAGFVLAGWVERGLPLLAGSYRSLSAVVVLLVLALCAGGVALTMSNAGKRRRLVGLISGTAALSESDLRTVPAETHPAGTAGPAPTGTLADSLRQAVQTSVGALSVTLQDLPPTAGQAGAPIAVVSDVGKDVVGPVVGTASGVSARRGYLVAHRDAMDLAFSGEDRKSVAALAHAADVVAGVRADFGGLALRANTDPLTALPNYGAFNEALGHLGDSRGHGESIAVLFLDLDEFKRINDRHGHHIGDEILRELGRRLQGSVRPYDLVARVGGDEFVVVLTGLSGLAEANLMAESLMTSCSMPIELDGITLVPVLSIGLAYSAHREVDVTALVREADRSMLAIKKNNHRGSPARESSINVSDHRSTRLNDSVARAIDDDRIELAFQPIVSLVSGRIWAFEALLRYTDPEFGAIAPSSFVEKAKRLGRLDELSRLVATKAMVAAAEFRLLEPSIACMTVNLEAGQLLPERMGDFVDDLSRRYPSITLCLELNERSVARVSAAVRAQADVLRDAGLMIALDDYGSLDSSVDALVRLPMDILKIDRSLVDDLEDIRQREVLTALQGFGDNLEYSMIVEGVENAGMARHLRALGIRSAQGFFYGVPETFENTRARLEENGSDAIVRVRSNQP